MKYVVFVPGIMGSILATPEGEEVWPPTPAETIFGYKRTAALMRDDLVVGDLVRAVSCFDVYKPIIATIAAVGYPEAGPGDRLMLYPYDWRRDLETLAEGLAARLDTVPAAATGITIVAHSMGGLIARLMLETGRYDARPWFAKITMFTSLATPHLGAPLALARILGLDSAMGISAADFRALAADPRYPSGYQLLPAPAEAACWDIKPGSALGALDIYDPAVAAKLGLDPALLARAAFVHQSLAAGAPPPHIRYFYFAATGHKTATRLNVGATTTAVTRQDDAGDGTVPLWSALPRSGQKQLVVGEHASFFAETGFKAVFYWLFGKNFPTPPILAGAAPAATLSVQSFSLRKTEEVELLIVLRTPAGKLESTLVLERTDGPDDRFAAFGPPRPVRYEGPPLPVLKLRLPPLGTPGFYRISLAGSPASEAPARFAVTDV
ncbi:MAG TPA: hypothetical protein VLA00_05520 [Xanthobacteraceae bacterium]|nr:hypothetical protein [Xanthobacteraceae bacterium]